LELNLLITSLTLLMSVIGLPLAGISPPLTEIDVITGTGHG